MQVLQAPPPGAAAPRGGLPATLPDLPWRPIEVVGAWARTHICVGLRRPGSDVVRELRAILPKNGPLRRPSMEGVLATEGRWQLVLDLDDFRRILSQARSPAGSRLGPLRARKHAVAATAIHGTVLSRIRSTGLKRPGSWGPGSQHQIQISPVRRHHAPNRFLPQMHVIPPHVLTRSRGRVVLAPQVWSAAGRRNVLLEPGCLLTANFRQTSLICA
mmetsp:Transcript_148335/g.210694  ORF Transcript_148335/g.210694 Transcript_148335/m.210694 type:complete len:216 (-) Transcript_148335:128-775(-)